MSSSSSPSSSPSPPRFIVVVGSNGKEVPIQYDQDKTTLAEFRVLVLEQVFGMNAQKEKETLEEQAEALRLLWCGVRIKEGASWHTGIIEEDDLIHDLLPGTISENGNTPDMHAHFILSTTTDTDE